MPSGEGNPDIAQKYDDFGFVKSGARWVDKRCHRSATAGAAQAAISIERSSYQSSVTFLSFACSGATIDRNISAREGAGILAPYLGADPAEGTTSFLPPQIQALAEAANGREIDALIISGGGNDMHFADIISDCVWHNAPRVLGTGGRCHEQPWVLDRLAADFAELPHRYDRLAAAIHDPNPEGRPALNVRNVYLTEYPDPTTDDDGSTCGSMLGEVIPTTPFDLAKIHIDRDEANWAQSGVLQPLNQAIAAAVDRQVAANRPWHFVSGVAAQYPGHGYCADDHWVVQVYESARQQGPVWKTTTSWGPILLFELGAQKGTMHPNAAGHRAYARQILEALNASEGPGPTFNTSNTAGGLTARQGANGWLTGSCDAQGACASDKAVLTVTAEDGAGIRGASLTVNDSDCSDVAGVTCTAGLDGANRYRWSFEITADGIYNLQLVASNRNGPSSTFLYDVKVDLHDPPAPTASVAAGTQGKDGWYVSPVDVKLDGADTAGGSGVALIEYRSPMLENNAWFSAGAGTTAVIGQDKTLPDGTIEAAAEGVYNLEYQAVDQAGRKSPAQTLTLKIDRQRPAITLTSPSARRYTLNQAVAASYSCADGGSGVASCTGNVADGSNFDTSSSGAKSFAVNSVDNAGNTSTRSVSYEVTYSIQALYDQSQVHKVGSTVPIKLRLQDAMGVNMSDASIVLTSVRLTKQDSTIPSTTAVASSANPDSTFRYDAQLGGYIYNYGTKGLSTGTWVMTFKVSGDPVEHTVKFDVR